MAETRTNRIKHPGWGSRFWAVLGALGILSVVGTGVFNALVDTGRDILFVPLSVNVTDRTPNLKFLFPNSVDPRDAPLTSYGAEGPGFQSWADQAGGVLFLNQEIGLVIRGTEAAPVVITDISVRVLRHRPTPSGWVNLWECGGRLAVREFKLDLREHEPRVRLFEHGRPQGDATFTVSSSDIEAFRLKVRARDGVVSWVLDIDYTSDGKDGTYTVKAPDGGPFEIAGGGDPLAFAVGETREGKVRLLRSPEARRMLRNGFPFC